MYTTKSSFRLATIIICFPAVLWAAACGDDTHPEDPYETNSSAKEDCVETNNTPERRHEVRLKYDDMFWRQPNVFGVSEGRFLGENGERLETKGILVKVTKKVDQSTLTPKDRIPECLEGIPVQLREYSEDERPSIDGWLREDTDEEEANGSN